MWPFWSIIPLMWIRSAGALALSLTLLLAATVGLAGHDHATAIELTGYDCAIDHERDDIGRREGPGPTLRAGAELHRHRCLACTHSGQRILLTSARLALGPGPGVEGPSLPRSLPRSSVSRTGQSVRGPPSV
jgi:hypothetical protein